MGWIARKRARLLRYFIESDDAIAFIDDDEPNREAS